MSEISAKMRQLLALLASFPDGKTSYEDYPDSQLAPFWDDNGTETDTFNQAIDQGLILATVDSDTDSGFAAITEAGRAALSADTGSGDGGVE